MQESELIEHPEGGRYKEVYRSEMKVTEGDRQRDVLTHIYFSLNADEVSRFHKVTSDEVWNIYEGNGVLLYLWDKSTMQCIELSSEKREYCYVVKAGLWQATAPISSKVLVGCSVAPGFEFEDFELIETGGDIAQEILRQHPDLKRLV